MTTEEVEEIKHSVPQVCWVSFGSGATSLANDLCAKTNTRFFLTPCAHAHENTHTHCWLHTMAWLYLQHQTDICQSPCGAHCYSTQGTQMLSRVQLPTDFAMQRESADEVCQHASLTPNSQKTTGSQHAPVDGGQEQGERRGAMTSQNISAELKHR